MNFEVGDVFFLPVSFRTAIVLRIFEHYNNNYDWSGSYDVYDITNSEIIIGWNRNKALIKIS